jgi:hypothetical protein
MFAAALYILAFLAIVGVGLYLFETLVSMDPSIKATIRVIVLLVVFLVVIYWLISILPGGPGFPLRMR